jgi:hypothetical protein
MVVSQSQLAGQCWLAEAGGSEMKAHRLGVTVVAVVTLAAALGAGAAQASRTPSWLEALDARGAAMNSHYGPGAYARQGAARSTAPDSVGLTGDSALKVDRAVAAANEAYNTYLHKTATAARESLFTDQPSVGLTGDSAVTRSSAPQHAGLTGDRAVTRYPGTVTLPTALSAGDGVEWSSFGLGAGMTALLAAGIAGVVLTTRRRGGIALP